MVKEFLKLEKKYNIPATYNVVGKLFREQPDLIEWIVERGQEVAFHSYNHQLDWQHVYYSGEIDLCRKVSSLPRGYRSPRSQWNQTALKTLWEKGFLWNAEYDPHKEPYFIYKGLVRLPIASDDWPIQIGKMNVDEWSRLFSKLLKRRAYFAFGSHDFVASFAPKERLKAWERTLQIAIENKALIVTFSEAADLFRRATLSRYYSTIAKNWNQSNKTFYRTKRFQELIRAEAEKLNRPVVADLGSGGGLLSYHLKDIVGKIYCVDNAPRMLKNIDSDSCIQMCLGEVTDSKLPDNSIDLVICARIIEYMFWPECLAHEIQRIGKSGATYFITFPVLREDLPPREESPPGKIRHYFTPDEIQKLVSQIGPGRLIGIQYERPEPDNPATEQRYRAIEKTPPAHLPTDLVYIGTIQKKFTPKNYRETIPLSAFNFQLPDQQHANIKMFKKLKSLLNEELEPWTPSWILQRALLCVKERRLHQLPDYMILPFWVIYYKAFLKKPKEISAMIRVKNEEDYLYTAVKSIIDYVEEVVLIDNLSTDKTPDIIESLHKEYPDKVACYRYPYEIRKVGKENLELMSKVSSRPSPNLLVNYYNWCLKKCTKPYILKWDGDMIATDIFYRVISKFKISNRELVYYRGINVHPDKEHMMAPIISDLEGLESQLFSRAKLDNYLTLYSNYEPSLFPKTFARYDTNLWWCECLRTPFFYFPPCIYVENEALFLHMKFCKKDPYSNFSNDIKKVVSDNISKGPPLNEELSRTLRQYLERGDFLR